MPSIADVAGQELIWVQPAALRREHELRAGDQVVGTLSFQRGSLADAETDGHHWTFKRSGFWHPRVTAREAGADQDVGVFRPHWGGGGVLESPDGHEIRLTTANFWQSEWVWLAKDHALINFRGRHGLIKANGTVQIEPMAATLPQMPMLVLLGWYLILLYADDAASAGGVAAASIAATSP